MRLVHLVGPLGLVVGFSAGSGCWRVATLHCANLEGDASCAGGEYCNSCEAANNGCSTTPPEAGCDIAKGEEGEPTPGRSSSEGTSSSGTDTVENEETDDEGLSTSGSTTTGERGCVNHDQCMVPDEPICNSEGKCVPCEADARSGMTCKDRGPRTSVCHDDGECVECTAEDDESCMGMLVCDDIANVCVCTEHDQCGDAACNLFTGACLPSDSKEDPNAVMRVGLGQEYTTLGEAMAIVAEGAQATIIVSEPMANYDEAVTVDGGRVVAFLAEAEEEPRWILGAGGSPQLTVTDGTVLMEGIQMSGNASTTDPGLLVNGGQAWVDRGRIVTNLGGGVVAQNSAELVLRNCFVGGDVSDQIAMQIADSSAEVLYSTLGAGFGSSGALACTGGSNVDIRNSVLVSRSTEDEVQCTLDSIEYSATELAMGETNTPLGDMDTAWFAGYGAGDFSLTMMGADMFRDVAQWQEGDPSTDIDGDARPNVDGTADYAGADVP